MTARVPVMRALAFALPFALAACATPEGGQSPSDRAAVHQVEGYFQTVDLESVPFVQIWPDGARGAGTLSYHPGALSMHFTQPHVMDLTAQGRHAVFTDSQTGAETHLGLAHNPLGLLLDNPMRLSGPVTVTDVQHGADGLLQLSLTRTDNPSQGLVTLRFRTVAGHLSLYEARIVDERRRVTLIDLEAL